METKDKQAIEQVIKAYFNSLNNSSASEAVALYAQNGIFMAADVPTSSGTKQLKTAYEHLFGAVKFINVGYTLDEITVEGNWAAVRTSSLGNMKVIAKDMVIEGSKHRELFTLQKINGEWKISHYMFNATAPVEN